MAIKKDTLHPEGEVGVDIYPKTSIDQVENLQANLDALNGDIANANGEISVVSNRVNANERNITDLQNYVNQNVEDLYMILEQAQVVTVTTLEQAYTTRETADGENIVDGVQTTVKEIRGKTVATENFIPYPYTETTKTANGVTFTVNSDGSITVNGTATYDTDFMLLRGPIQGYSESYFLSGCPSGGSDTTYYISENFTASKDTGNGVVLNNLPSDQVWRIVIKSGTTVNNLIFRPMLNVGTEAKPYSKWFAGLKNASFEKIVSTSRNLLSPSDVLNGIFIDENEATSENTNIYRSIICYLPAGTYTLSSNISLHFIKKMVDGTISSITTDGTSYTITSIQTGFIGLAFRRTDDMNYDDGTELMLNYGSSALPYEPYISDTLSAETPIELAEYDVAYPETGETKRQSKTVVFDGTEIWNEVSSDIRYQYIYTLPVLADKNDMAVVSNLFVANSENGISLIGETNDGMTSVRVRGNKNERPDIDTLDKWKAYLAAQSAAGNPLTVTYKTAESTTETTPFNKSKYIAWKNGSETIDQGVNDNSEYGAENTVKQDYFTLTGGTTNDTNN